jgi:hypothetical protein
VAYGNYVRNPTWVDGSGGGTAIDAADLNANDVGVFNAFYQPAVRAWAGAATSCTNATWTTQALNSEDFDQAGNASDTQHDTVTNNSRLTCRYAGVYQISAQGSFAATAGGTTRQCRLFLNNATVIGPGSLAAPSATVFGHVTAATLYKLAVNDYVEFQAYQDSGGALNFTTSFLCMVRVG